MSRLDTLEHFVAKVDIAMGKVNDFMARVDLAMETMRGDLQSFSVGMVGLLRDTALGRESHMIEGICKQAWQGCRGMI
jgi:hypothetical protein